MALPRVPLLELPEELAADLAGRGGRPINLYRALANQPTLLRAWIDFAWTLRGGCGTSRALRELVILRVAQLAGSQYEWTHHRRMAAESGVGDAQVAALANWRSSPLFDERERAALTLADAMSAGAVPEAVHAELARHFGPAELVELTLTAGFYCMVPRVLAALDVPLESDPG